VLRMCCGCVADVLRMCCGCVADVLRMCCGCVAGVLRMCCGCVADVLLVCCGCVADVLIRFFLSFFFHSFFSRCMYADKALYSESMLLALYSDLHWLFIPKTSRVRVRL